MKKIYCYSSYFLLIFLLTVFINISCIKDPSSPVIHSKYKLVYKLGFGGNIYIIDEDGKNKTHIAEGRWPQWSPNGDLIAYYGGGGLEIIKTDGTDRRILTKVTPDSGGTVLNNLSWSPDGRKIVFISSKEIPWNVHVINIETLEEKRITNGGVYILPSFCPDGSKVSFCGQNDQEKRRGLYIANTDGSGIFRLLKKAHFVQYFWHPNGKKIAFDADLDGAKPYDICVYKSNLDGTNIIHLFDANKNVGPFSPDGSKILFFDVIKWGMFALKVINVKGSTQKTLVDIDPEKDSVVLARWSPDGNKIAYTMVHKEKPYCSLWVMNADGSNKRKLDEIPEGVYPAVIGFDWSPF